MLERLVLRPELSAFEQALTERIALVAGLEDERFSKPRAIEKDGDRLTVVSEYVAGRRLSDIIDAAADHGIVAGIDAGLGLLLELLPAVARLHDAGLVHGAFAPGRLMITPAGLVLVLDSIYGEPLERLQLTRKRLWSEFRLAFPPTAGLARFDRAADLGHASMVAATLIIGRALQDNDYPEGIALVRREIHEIASIRGTKAFADGVDKFFGSTLPLAGRKGNTTTSADEAAIDLRKLVRKELGINTCRTALLEFLQQVEAADAELAAAEAAEAAERAARGPSEAERLAQQQAEAARVEAERRERERREAGAREKARSEAERKARDEAERKARDEGERKAREEAERRAREEAERKAQEEAERKARDEAERKAREQAERKTREEAERKAREEAERKAREEAERKAREEAERRAHEEAERKAREEAERKAREEADRKARE
ncbi:MAG TPA: hypothetical protein VEL51_06805, partial [Vicinamibacterales bacterium]|nr:hypothetical protein [Vicinamibacterales bacterium]